jgi:hypothetical protein
MKFPMVAGNYPLTDDIISCRKWDGRCAQSETLLPTVKCKADPITLKSNECRRKCCVPNPDAVYFCWQMPRNCSEGTVQRFCISNNFRGDLWKPGSKFACTVGSVVDDKRIGLCLWLELRPQTWSQKRLATVKNFRIILDSEKTRHF